ncbi:MAG: S41 family peptidase [Gammaproteobacteria bacterium]|nr:S41 family peptidase [Gammaproteobacteria bacterium]
MSSQNLRTVVRLSMLRESIKKLIFVIVLLSAVGTSHADERISPKTNYIELAAAINATMRTYHYNPEELDTPEYLRIEEAISALGRSVTSDEEFTEGFREIWSNGPFSHVTINEAQQSADDLADYLDTMRIGGGGASLGWQGDVAILTVNTMMGLDTIEEIDAAYAAIAERNASGLIIDLRENGGGAFAVRPLVSHLLTEAFDAGGFVSQPWNTSHGREPNKADLEAVEPWEGWSVRTFWADVQTNAITRISFSPAQPVFDGPVYILTSKHTASAAELATDALRVADRVTIIGERTAGEMLSQTIFDIPGGFHLSLPIADYYSVVNGRIEGVGIEPDIEVEAAHALDTALEILKD